MSHWFYITPEEYERAAAIGVDNQTIDRRVRELGWKKDRAITTPIRPIDKNRRYWRLIAEKNGIQFAAFHSRITRGWTDEEAATRPLQTQEDNRRQALQATEKIRKIPKWCIDLAEQNGIAYHTMRMRIKKGWNLEEAATAPVMTKRESGKRGAKALRDREGDWAALIFGKRQ